MCGEELKLMVMRLHVHSVKETREIVIYKKQTLPKLKKKHPHI